LPPQRLNNTLSPQVEPILRKALAKLPDDRYDTCTEFISALATACNANPAWTPLPRGTSPNMPTAGGDLAETVADTRSPVNIALATDNDATRILAPSPQPPSSPPPPPAPVVTIPVAAATRVLEIEPERSHVWRNVLLSLATVAVLVVVVLVATLKPAAQPPAPPPPAETQAAPVAPPPESTPVPQTAATPEAAPSRPVAIAPRAPAAPSEGAFALTTSPSGATATFDASGIECTTPCNLTLPNGRHTFVLRHAGFRDIQKIITIPNDTGLIVDLVAMSGTLNLITNPPGASVLVDGREQAQKTPLSLALPVGPHKIQLVKGNERQELDVDLSDGQFISKTVSWQ
jgi:hypothetical protein